jgi:hypothetical protein
LPTTAARSFSVQEESAPAALVEQVQMSLSANASPASIASDSPTVPAAAVERKKWQPKAAAHNPGTSTEVERSIQPEEAPISAAPASERKKWQPKTPQSSPNSSLTASKILDSSSEVLVSAEASEQAIEAAPVADAEAATRVERKKWNPKKVNEPQ